VSTVTAITLSPLVSLGVVVAAAYLMIHAGMAKRRLVWRDRRCPVCGRPRSSCICYWG
jgi:hypothetical protein